MRGSSIRRPPISEPLVFIHAGGLHGDAMTCSRGLIASASRSSGRTRAWSCAMEKSRC